jgi:ribosomal protein L27
MDTDEFGYFLSGKRLDGKDDIVTAGTALIRSRIIRVHPCSSVSEPLGRVTLYAAFFGGAEKAPAAFIAATFASS